MMTRLLTDMYDPEKYTYLEFLLDRAKQELVSAESNPDHTEMDIIHLTRKVERRERELREAAPRFNEPESFQFIIEKDEATGYTLGNDPDGRWWLFLEDYWDDLYEITEVLETPFSSREEAIEWAVNNAHG